MFIMQTCKELINKESFCLHQWSRIKPRYLGIFKQLHVLLEVFLVVHSLNSSSKCETMYQFDFVETPRKFIATIAART